MRNVVRSVSTTYSGVVNGAVLFALREQDRCVFGTWAGGDTRFMVCTVSGQVSRVRAEPPQVSAPVAGTPVSTASQECRDWLEFEALAKEWKQSRQRHRSFAYDMARDPNYLKIIWMGPRAVPLILRQLRDELAVGKPDHWFTALWFLTGGENPIPKESRGKMSDMARAWLEWGERRGLLDARLGSGVPQSR